MPSGITEAMLEKMSKAQAETTIRETNDWSHILNQKAAKEAYPVGLRFDNGKARYDLLPYDALEVLAKVYTDGAVKYAPRNWEKGMDWSRMFGSLVRHAFAFWRGEDNDKESGSPHMAHVAWNALGRVTKRKRPLGISP